MPTFSDPMVVSLDDFIARGTDYMKGREGLWQEMLDSRRLEDLAILVYTSGTTGPPKGTMHANKSVLAQMRHADTLFPVAAHEERLLFLPLCHVAERVGGYYYSLATGSIMNFAESPETVPDNIREVQPTAFLAVPRVWEKFYSAIMIALKDATPLEKWAYQCAIGIGYRMAEHRLRGSTPSSLLRLANAAAYWLVLRNIRKMLGVDRCRLLYTGAAPISPDLIKWYLALGLNMYEVYGQTENCGVADLDAGGKNQARHRRPVGSLGRGKGFPGRRNPDQGRFSVHGLSQQAGKDGGDHRPGWLAAYGRRRNAG